MFAVLLSEVDRSEFARLGGKVAGKVSRARIDRLKVEKLPLPLEDEELLNYTALLGDATES